MDHDLKDAESEVVLETLDELEVDLNHHEHSMSMDKQTTESTAQDTETILKELAAKSKTPRSQEWREDLLHHFAFKEVTCLW